MSALYRLHAEPIQYKHCLMKQKSQAGAVLALQVDVTSSLEDGSKGLPDLNLAPDALHGCRQNDGF